MSWHYRAETKGIQQWIFSTSKLRDLKGGSEVIENLKVHAAELRKSLSSEPHVIQEAAGGLWYRFESRADLERFAADWPFVVSQAAPGLQVVHAWSSAEDPREELNHALRGARNAPPTPLPEAGPWLARSGRSGLPALRRDDSWPASPHHQLHWDAAQVVKEIANSEVRRRRWVDDVDLGLAERGEGLLAVIHADGTGIGNRFLTLPMADVQAFSKKLEDAAKGALSRAIGILAERRKSRRLEMQVVVSGGDDLTVICAAELALPFTEAWLTAFEVATTEALGAPGLRAGAGIAITARRYPFRRAYRLAEDLCKDAKKLAKDEANQPIDSVVALRRVTTDLDDDDHTFGQGLWRLGRATSCETPIPTLASLIALRDAARKLPRGGLRTWLTAFEATPHDDSKTADRLWRRMREVARTDDFDAFLKALTGAGASATGLGPAIADKARRWTPIRDALTLGVIERRGGSDSHGS